MSKTEFKAPIVKETPSSHWLVQGQPDPHGERYQCARNELAMGHLTDDEVANAVFMYDHRSGLQSMAYLQAAQDRIRWLSRQLAAKE